MKQYIRKHGLKAAGAVTIGALLITAACAKVNPEPVPAAAPAAQEAKKQEAPLRTGEVFDKEKYKGQLTIRYFDLKDQKVGTGDSILITSPEGKTMLIDAGIADSGWQVVRYLDQLGIDTLDIALNTHPHSDHIGGYAEILKKKDAKAFYMENLPFPSSGAYRNAMAQVEKKKIPVTMLEEGDTFELGKELKFEVFSPKKGALPAAVTNYDATTLNFFSLVIKMTYRDNTFLFPADIYKDKEMELVTLHGKKFDTDFVHAPHHGSSTSSSSTFIDAVTPKVAVISMNLFNRGEVLKAYEKKGAAVYATGLNGNILITSDGSHMKVIAEKDRPAVK
ncbi:hypothetical protein PAESOLCIP111_00142 [Paenibacillus solanacearum]|uniref:Metallo-beta-lactamase domain-containing protein n=1 Tax=Paenibacillus solanacearum TaxID=2048548 RepID=A0A916NL15_9BACL|nr:MBL fold metallo-hydrolase [Paenibacillus solanacearum]CAG7597380.1 hypothetical protein PAESOLCIP111_00142 [Paenibacillus solanacearum]